MNLTEARESLDKVIKKAKVHLYKPIQIAEILYRDRVVKDIDLSKLETYRTKSKKWRDTICIPFLGRTSTSSAKYQDNLFNKNAVPPEAIVALGTENRKKNGIVEAYIYNRFKERYVKMSDALEYAKNSTPKSFVLSDFLNLFWNEPGLKRSIDKIYEIIVYSLFSVLIDELEVNISVNYNSDKIEILKEFEIFAKKVIQISSDNTNFVLPAKINRVGITNAADRGIDMWANFGASIQVKHLSLSEKLAKNIVTTIMSDSIVIVCKDSEKSVINSLLNQLGWKSRIQSIIVESELIEWYERALRGRFAPLIGTKLLETISDELILEFPSSDNSEFIEFYNHRGYNQIKDDYWELN